MSAAPPATDPPPIPERFDGPHPFPVHGCSEDTDLSGIVYPADTLRHLEREAGIDQRAATEAGEDACAFGAPPLRFVASAGPDDASRVASTMEAATPARIAIHQRVRRRAASLPTSPITAAFPSLAGRPSADRIVAFQPLLP